MKKTSVEIPYRFWRICLPWNWTSRFIRFLQNSEDFGDLEKCENNEKFSFRFQAISNKHNCCNSNNNNCIKICDSQIAQAGKEKEKEGLVKDEEESYNKFRQLLDYDDVSLPMNCFGEKSKGSNHYRSFVRVFSVNLLTFRCFTGSKLSPVQSIHSQRIPLNAAYKTLLGIGFLVDERNGTKKRSFLCNFYDIYSKFFAFHSGQHMVAHIRFVSVHRTLRQRHCLSQDSRTFCWQIDCRWPSRVLPNLHVPVFVLPHFLLPVGERLWLFPYVRLVRHRLVTARNLRQRNLLRFLVSQCKFMEMTFVKLLMKENFKFRSFGTFTLQQLSSFSWYQW